VRHKDAATAGADCQTGRGGTGNDRDMRILKETADPEKLITLIDQAPQSASDRLGAARQTPG